MYFQVAFALDRVKALAPQHPSGRRTQPFTTALAGDMKGARSVGREGHRRADGGDARRHHDRRVREDRLRLDRPRAKHPRFERLYTELVYQPMLELLAYLRENGFKTYIVSGGGIEFMRPWTERVYGIPPEQVIGSSSRDRVPAAAGRQARADHGCRRSTSSTTRPASPSGSSKFIGRRPILAFGNSDGDQQMLEWTAAGSGRALPGARPPHRRRARMGIRSEVARSASSTRRSTKRTPGAGRWST